MTVFERIRTKLGNVLFGTEPTHAIEILKVDPHPCRVNLHVTIVFRVTSLTNDSLFVRLSGLTDEKRVVSFKTTDFELPAKESHVDVATTFFVGAGTHSVDLVLTKRTDQQILVGDGSPTPALHAEYVYDEPASASATLSVFDGLTEPKKPIAVDVSPNEPNGTINGDAAFAGVMGRLAGSTAILFGVSKTAGVWRSVQSGPWEQLRDVAPLAHCIDVDPQDHDLIAVGERGGDSSDIRFDRCGVWESRDSGNHWELTWEPLLDTGSPRVHGVVFSRTTHTLFIATDIGVARRPGSNALTRPAVELPPTANGIGPVTAITVSETRVWARAGAVLLVSDDDGVTWARHQIDPNVDLPGFPQARIALDTEIAGGNDNASLAAFDDVAYLVFIPEDQNGKALTNLTSVLIFDATAPTGTQWRAQLSLDGDGRGLGGRRFLKAYVLACPNLPMEMDQRRKLFLCSAQGIQQALSENADKTLVWRPPLMTSGADAGVSHKPIHSDIWDFHIGFEYCPPKNVTAWLAGDGGVFRGDLGGGGPFTRPNPEFMGFVGELDWRAHNDGLHTHNIHNVLVVPQGPGLPARLAYSTTDNDGWWRKADGSWRRELVLGDADRVLGDALEAECFLISRGDSTVAWESAIARFDDNQYPARFTDLNPSLQDLVIVQTRAYTPLDHPRLDAVMLTRLPVIDGGVFRGPFVPGQYSGPMGLVRNRYLASSNYGPPDHPIWELVSADLPKDAVRIWVSGGHTQPVFYLLVRDSKQKFNLHRGEGQAGSVVWQQIFADLLPASGPLGPAFVDPYDPMRLFVVVADEGHPFGAIKLSTDGGASFRTDEVLTALLTESGRYRLGTFTPDPQLRAVGSKLHGFPLYNPSHVAFSPYNPGLLAVASPMGAVYFANVARGCLGSSAPTRQTGWKSIGESLPRPIGYVSNVGFDAGPIFVATEGRGIFMISQVETGLPATYFDFAPASLASGALAVLKDNLGDPVPWTSVLVSIFLLEATTTTLPSGAKIDGTRRHLVANEGLRTDADGLLTHAGALVSGDYLVTLQFPGDGKLAPCNGQHAL